MAKIRLSVSLVLSALAVCSAFNVFVPSGKELVYDYSASLEAGTHIPTLFTSSFYITGKLHVQPNGQAIKFMFSDLKYNIHNGENYHNFWTNLKRMDVPKEMVDLIKPFQVNYDVNGIVQSIDFVKGEAEYVKNMKKSVASIFQMDMQKVDFNKHVSFFTPEPSIYGVHEMAYNVIPSGDHFEIHKAHHMKSMARMYPYHIASTEQEFCEESESNHLGHNMQRKYVIKTEGDHKIVQVIQAFGGFSNFAFNARSHAHSVFSNQTFVLAQEKSIEKAIVVEEPLNEKDLGYKMFSDGTKNLENAENMFLGRRHYKEVQLDVVNDMLESVIKHMNKNHITNEIPDVHEGQIINRILRYMLSFNYSDFETIFKSFSEKNSDQDKTKMEIFQQMLPLVGTKSSVTFMKEMIQQKKIKDVHAIKMLHKFPFNVKFPTEELLEEMKDMINWDDSINLEVRKAAIIAFGSLIHKTYDAEKKIHLFSYTTVTDEKHITHGKHDMEMLMEDDEHFLKEHPHFIKYVQMIGNKFKETKDMEMKVTALSALVNTKLDYVLQYLEPIVTGEEDVSEDLRLYAIYGIMPIVGKNSAKVYELYWPIMTNHSLPVDLRIGAYFGIMESHPSMSTLINIYWTMQLEMNNHQLYKFHYEYLKSMAQTTDNCHNIFKERARSILKYTKPPMYHGMEGFYRFDYTDSKYNFGDDFQFLMTKSKSAHTFGMMYYSNVMNALTNPLSVFFRVYGLEDVDVEKLKLNHEDSSEMFNFKEIFSKMGEVMKKDNFKIELFVLSHGQVVHFAKADKDNWTNVKSTLLMYSVQTGKQAVFDINYDYYDIILVPNDMGFLTKIETFVPSVKLLKVDDTKSTTGISFNHRYTTWRNSWNGMSFYNPFADVWQGIYRLHSYDSSMPIHLHVALLGGAIKVTLKRTNDEDLDVMGIRTHVVNMVFVKDDFKNQILKTSCPQCENWVEVTKVSKRNVTIYDHECKTTGLRSQMMSFDDELGTTSDRSAVGDYFFLTENKNFNTPFGHMLLAHIHLQDLMTYHPLPLTNGFLFRTVPSKINRVSEIEIDMRVSREIVQEENVVIPGWKGTFYVSYQAKLENGKPLKAMSVDGKIDLKPGHKLNNYKMLIEYQDPEIGKKVISVDGTRKFHEGKDTGRLTIAHREATATESTKSDIIMDITMEGVKKPIPTTEEYGACVPYLLTYPKNNYKHFYTQCVTQVDAFTDYAFTTKTQNVPEYLNETLMNVLAKTISMNTYGGEMKKEIIDKDTFTIDLHYPSQGEYVMGQKIESHGSPYYKYLMDYKVSDESTFRHQHPLLTVPLTTAMFYGLRSTNMRFSRVYEEMYNMGMIKNCHVDLEDVVIDDKTKLSHKMTNEWTLYAGYSEKHPKCGFFAKMVDKQIAMRLVFEDKHLEVYPSGDKGHFKIIINDKEMDGNQIHYSEDTFAIAVQTDMVIVFAYEVGATLIYTPDHIHSDIPNHSSHLTGLCFSKE